MHKGRRATGRAQTLQDILAPQRGEVAGDASRRNAAGDPSGLHVSGPLVCPGQQTQKTGAGAGRRGRTVRVMAAGTGAELVGVAAARKAPASRFVARGRRLPAREGQKTHVGSRIGRARFLMCHEPVRAACCRPGAPGRAPVLPRSVASWSAGAAAEAAAGAAVGAGLRSGPPARRPRLRVPHRGSERQVTDRQPRPEGQEAGGWPAISGVWGRKTARFVPVSACFCGVPGLGRDAIRSSGRNRPLPAGDG